MSTPTTKDQSENLSPDKQRCVWMTAGVLSYELCDRNFDCDHCPLDAAVRRRSGTTTDAGPTNVAVPANRPMLKTDCEYSRNHFWARKVKHEFVRVGLEPGFAAALLVPKAIAFPLIGDRVKEKDACVWVILDCGTLPLSAPLEGLVLNTNGAVAEWPHLLSGDPFDAGWLFDLGVDEKTWMQAKLAPAEKAAKWYEEDERILRDALVAACSTSELDVGVTVADGGRRLQSVADSIGAEKYFEVLSEVFGKLRR